MLAAKNMLSALESENVAEEYRNCNDDYDFGRVLECYGNEPESDYEVICSDGEKRSLLF